ncbi:MAG: hypothetical protein QXU18_12080 [Thermoplasmatales archaeon]
MKNIKNKLKINKPPTLATIANKPQTGEKKTDKYRWFMSLFLTLGVLDQHT